MWTTRCEELAGAVGLRFAIDLDSRPAAFADVLRGWQGDASFRSFFNSLLADAATNKVLGRIEVGPRPHGIAASRNKPPVGRHR